MARKPKAAPSNKPDLPAQAVPAAVDKGAPPARRGRKPAPAAPVPEPSPAVDGGAAKAGAALLASPAGGGTPARGRPGRKPKGLEEAAATSLVAQALEQRPDGDGAGPAASDDALIAEMAYPVSAGEGSGDTDAGAVPPPAAQDSSGSYTAAPDTTAPPEPAARWDRATDTVAFNWPAIERTASRDGPNQAMARLLVAARAEGANSRWPF